MESTGTPSQSHDSGLLEILAWIELHKKQLLIGVGVIAVGALGWSITSWSREQKELAASQALMALKPAPAAAGVASAAIPADSYLQVASRFANTDAGRHAVLLAASQLFAEGKYAEAQKQFETFMAASPDSPFMPQARLGIAASLEAQGKTAEALKKYEEVSQFHPGDVAAPQAKLSLARLYEADNKLPQAFRLYDELSPKSPQDMMRPRWYMAQAMARRGKLAESHPELVPAPVSTPAAPSVTNVIPLQPKP